MTKKITAILSAFALGALAVPALAAPHPAPDSPKAADMAGVMAVGNPHSIRQVASADETRLENMRIEERRRAELSEWEALFGRHLFPAMGVGGHTR